MEQLQEQKERIDERIEETLDATEPGQLRDQVRHVALSGGKRVRPTVTLLVCDVLDGDEELAMDFAVGIELVHNASLVVDDIIDKSDTRRGSPAAWTAYGHGPAVVTSDGLLGEAFELFSGDERAMQAVAESMVDLGEGEATELVAQPDSEREYKELARRKTGALFRAAAELGAIAADSDPYTIEAFGQYAERVGVAFQMRDDVLDATADAETLGKPTGHDAEMDRPSVVEVTDLTPEEATRRAQEEAEAALSAIDGIDIEEEEVRQFFQEFAAFVVERDR